MAPPSFVALDESKRIETEGFVDFWGYKQVDIEILKCLHGYIVNIHKHVCSCRFVYFAREVNEGSNGVWMTLPAK